MENLKVRVNNWDESKEVQELFFALGYNKESVSRNFPNWISNFDDLNGRFYKYTSEPSRKWLKKCKELTIQQLKHLVVLKRNGVNGANYESESGNRKYYLTDAEFFEFILGVWVNIDELVDGMSFKKIEKDGEVKMKEYLDSDYELRSVKQTSGDNHVPIGWVEVPEGAEIFLLDKSFCEDTLYFVKHDGEVFHEYYTNATDVSNNSWIKGTIKELHKGMGKVLWQRNPGTTNTSTQEKLKFIEKWLNGEKIQYILGIESEKTQSDKSKWHNFTEGAMQYIKRHDIKFREAPKYVTINGIEFKSVEKLLKYVKNNFDLEDGE